MFTNWSKLVASDDGYIASKRNPFTAKQGPPKTSAKSHQESGLPQPAPGIITVDTTRPPLRRRLLDIRSPKSIVRNADQEFFLGGRMLAALGRVDRYRKEANGYAELAKDASPAFLAEIYRKVAVRYVFMAEELLKGPDRDVDAIERADQMISRLRSDASIEGI
jgi:hypothetical protein